MKIRLFVPISVALVAILSCGRGAAADPKPPAQPAPGQRPRLVAQLGHTDSIRAMAFSPDGRRLLTASDESARLWDLATGMELLQITGIADHVHAVAFTPDGRRLLTAGTNRTRLWDALTGRELRQFTAPELPWATTVSPDGRWVLAVIPPQKKALLWDVASDKGPREIKVAAERVVTGALALAPDGRRFLTKHSDKTIRLWDATSGRELRHFDGAIDRNWMTFAPDGRRIAAAGPDRAARVWDADNGKELRRFEGISASLVFSPDGRALLGHIDGKTRLWDAETGAELHKFEAALGEATFSPDGKRVAGVTAEWEPHKSATGEKGPLVSRVPSAAPVLHLWDAATWKELRQFRGLGARIGALARSPDGRRVAATGAGRAVLLWDLRTGGGPRSLMGHTDVVEALTFSPDGRHLLSSSLDGTTRVWDTADGKEVMSLKSGWVLAVVYSADGRRILTGGGDKEARLWDAESGKELLQLTGHTDIVGSVAFSSDGKRLVTGSLDQTVREWDAETGKELRRLGTPGLGHGTATVSPDGRWAVSRVGRAADGPEGRPFAVWDVAAGKELCRLEGHFAPFLHRVAFSGDGKRLLTGGTDGSVRLWDAATGKELRQFHGAGATVPAAKDIPPAKTEIFGGFGVGSQAGRSDSAAFLPDGRLVTGGADGALHFWDAATGKELCRAMSFRDGSWAAVDPEGRYDASNGGDIAGLHWVVGFEPIALSQLKERYYEPNLLAKHLGYNKEPLRDVAALDGVKLYPSVAVAPKGAGKPLLDVTLTNRGGGIGRVVVLLNGKELTSDARPRGAEADAAKLSVPLDLSGDPRLVPGQKNKVEVLAYNADGYLCSRGMVREFDDPGKPPADPPNLYAVVAGVSNYRNDKLNLRYAAKDADDFAKALTLAAGGLFGAEKVHVTRLTGAAEGSRPGRAALARALEGLKDTKPGDVIVVYLAGHGATQGGQDGEWYYLSADAQSADLADPEVRKQVALSSAQLTDWLKAAPALKQVLILDTCHSGRLVEKLTEKRDVPGSQVRALERVKDRTGMYVLAGCAADSVSYEATRYGQGLLTYSLLLGMKGGKLREGEYVDVADLFGFAADKVPELAHDIGGVQRPLIASPRGAPFDIGRLTDEDRKKVPLQSVKPVVLRSTFQDEKQLRDALGLTRRVNDRLRDAAAAPRGARLVFVDADEFPGGMQAAGRYRRDGDKVSVSVTLFAGEKEEASFTVAGSADKPDELAEKIAAEIEKKLATAGAK